MRLYTELFSGSTVDAVARHAAGEGGLEGRAKFGQFSLGGQTFIAMDSGIDHDFTFSEAQSFQIMCDSQEGVDHFWARLTADGEEQPCGWLKGRFGFSWQVVPTALLTYLDDPDRAKRERVMRAMLQMSKKLDIAALTRAYEGDAA